MYMCLGSQRTTECHCPNIAHLAFCDWVSHWPVCVAMLSGGLPVSASMQLDHKHATKPVLFFKMQVWGVELGSSSALLTEISPQPQRFYLDVLIYFRHL